MGLLYRYVESIGLGALEAVSRGVGDNRLLSIVRKGTVPKQVRMTMHTCDWVCLVFAHIG